MDHRRFDVAGDDAPVPENVDGRCDVHFVAEADDARIAHGDVAEVGQVAVLLAADVAVDVADARGQRPFVQLPLVGQYVGLEKARGNHLVGGGGAATR